MWGYKLATKRHAAIRTECATRVANPVRRRLITAFSSITTAAKASKPHAWVVNLTGEAQPGPVRG